MKKLLSIVMVFLVVLPTISVLAPQVKAEDSSVLRDGYITRDQMMDIAEEFKTHGWNPTIRNVYHRQCVDICGNIKTVDTPDRDTHTEWEADQDWKGWKTDQENIGVPYQWGGFSSISEFNFVGLPEDFDDQLSTPITEEKNYHAGDKYCHGCECPYACGVDCSGFVSRCWNLSDKESSMSLANRDFSWPVKFEDLKRGDILNCAGAHVILFKEFVTLENRNTPGETKIRVYEASGKDWKVSEWEYVLDSIAAKVEIQKGIEFKTDEIALEIVGRINPDDGNLDTTILHGFCDGLTYIPHTYNPIKKGLLWLRDHQNPDGSWTYSGRITEKNVGITAMAATCFLNYGIGESDPTVKTAIEWILSEQNYDGSITTGVYYVYDTSLAILALIASGNKEYYDEIENAVNYLIAIQNDEDTGFSESDIYYGGWPYWSGMNWADLSNTQFVSLALYSAEKANPEDTLIPVEVWDETEIFLQRCQNREESNPDYNFYDDGGFIYQPRSTIWAGGRSYGSMTAAGVWSFVTAGVSISDPRMEDALGWLENNYHIDQNYPIGNQFLYYYLYCLAKANILTDTITVNGHNWYQEMRDFLIDPQQADGRWIGTDAREEPDNVATCWAILALETKAEPVVERTLDFVVESPVDLHVYSPLGKHVGLNYTTGMVEIEIPGASYSGPEAEPQIISIPDPISGTYRVGLVGRESGTYTLTIEGLVDSTTVYSESYTGTIDAGELYDSEATVSAIAGALTIWTTEPEFKGVIDNTPPSINIQTPVEGQAVQDGVTLEATVSDPSGVDWVTFSIRESDGTMIDPMYESMSAMHTGDNAWTLSFDTTQLPDGYYLFVVNASDMLGNEGTMTVDFSIRNWACIELLPASESNKGGRTMPVKFSLRVVEAVDPDQPFVWNEELTILIYEKNDPETILQNSTYGDTARDYRIDPEDELYITNFRTLKKKKPTTYVVEIYRKDMLIGTIEFNTQK